ncbi:phage tail assembly chaperone G [Salinicoccus halodurans]|uniref:Phage protein n=1 Tax=Salinicoccus halodurans TaxID=407035 RepID=A0A0F7D4J8_9STAP|nr:hypothetical protein [Salinicoccus halodurans]AKG74360.1 hypothetical protein AAT16_09010 [Salinicoccus halodurans]SFK94964.1 hypothetical protein SAMN05216235_2699 [Salinicoccus halodurans]
MKKNFIKFVKNVKEVEEKNAEPQFETFLTPSFIPFRKMYDATEALEAKEGADVTEKEAMDIMMDMVVDIYGKQFTKDDILDKLHSPDTMEELESQIGWVAQGKMNDDRKKQLAKMI